MLAQKLKKLLDENHVNYKSIPHSPTYTAQQTAQSAHIPGKELAKTVVVKIDNQLAFIIIPADMHINFNALEKELKNDHIELANESDFQDKFPECEMGAMPPFGNLYNLDTYVAEELSEDEKIAFNGGTHSELVQLKYDDYEKLVKPKVIKITEEA